MLGLFSSLHFQREYALQDKNGLLGCALSCDSKLLLLLWQAWFLSSKSNHCLAHPVAIHSKTPTHWLIEKCHQKREPSLIFQTDDVPMFLFREQDNCNLTQHGRKLPTPPELDDFLLLHHIICALRKQTVKRRRQWWGSQWIRVTGILFYKPILWCRRSQVVWP